MFRLITIVGIFLFAISLLILNYDCTRKPNKDELTKLEETKLAAESAEKKLEELKQERLRLELELKQKQEELKRNEEERDEIKKKLGK
jgi:septal ring factor EnvC (AmiA/AmiB activator)